MSLNLPAFVFWYWASVTSSGNPPKYNALHISACLTVQDPNPNHLRPTTSPNLLHARLRRQQHLARYRQRLRQLHGRLRLEWLRRWTGRDIAARDYRGYPLPPRARRIQHLVFHLLLRLSHGRAHHLRSNGTARRLAELLLVERRSSGACFAAGGILFPGDEMEPSPTY